MGQMSHSSPAIDVSITQLLDRVPVVIALLDENQQVVFGRDRLVELTGSIANATPGKAGPGDLMGCINAIAAEGGCGTSEACELCGANCAIVRSRSTDETVTQECRIRYEGSKGTGDLDLRVTATPYSSAGRHYTMLTVLDTSNEKRRRALERVFFHDITNIAGGLAGLAHVIQGASSTEELGEMLRVMERSARSLLDEIESQRQLASAELGELHAQRESVDPRALLAGVAETMSYHSAAEGRTIAVEPTAPEPVNTDPVLLRRVVVNLTKNALEAVSMGESVRLSAQDTDGSLMIRVWNRGVIPPDVQAQLFQRSFSTKGDGRGLGTYSVRLLTERYLGGAVTFRSNPDEHTVFVVTIPRGQP